MKLNKIHVVTDGLDKIIAVCDGEVDDVIDALVGVCWDEEDAGALKFYYAEGQEE